MMFLGRVSALNGVKGCSRSAIRVGNITASGPAARHVKTVCQPRPDEPLPPLLFAVVLFGVGRPFIAPSESRDFSPFVVSHS